MKISVKFPNETDSDDRIYATYSPIKIYGTYRLYGHIVDIRPQSRYTATQWYKDTKVMVGIWIKILIPTSLEVNNINIYC